MATRMRTAIFRHLGELRWEPTEKRVRASLGGEVVADTTEARLVWEPRRVVPTYAVPVTSLSADLVPTARSDEVALDEVGLSLPAVSDRPVLDPSIPFAVHTTEGDAVEVRSTAAGAAAGFRPADPDLAGHVVLDFDAFAWLEEDEPVVSHPRDPFHRIDVLDSSRHVVIERDGVVLAESTSPRLLFETSLPTRYYLARDDIRIPLEPSGTRTYCAYKGEAGYWSPILGGRTVPDLAWSYEQPLHDASRVDGRICFFDEKVDLTVDGERRERPVTPWT